jgi:hypothetical protein
VDYELEVSTPAGKKEKRILRVWQGFVMVVHQNCEIEFAHDDDSRLLVAPIVSSAHWPEARWSELRENRIPGYLYLPSIEEGHGSRLGLSAQWPESAVALASTTSTSIGLVKPRRLFSLSAEIRISRMSLSGFMQ